MGGEGGTFVANGSASGEGGILVATDATSSASGSGSTATDASSERLIRTESGISIGSPLKPTDRFGTARAAANLATRVLNSVAIPDFAALTASSFSSSSL